MRGRRGLGELRDRALEGGSLGGVCVRVGGGL